MERYVLPHSRAKLIVNMLFSLVAFGVLVMLCAISFRINWWIFILCGLGAIYFFLQVVPSFRYIFRPGIILIADYEGILDKSQPHSPGRIYWEEIKEIHAEDFMKTKFIGITLKDQDAFLERLDKKEAETVTSNLRFKCSPIMLVLENSAVPRDEVLANIKLVETFYKTNPDELRRPAKKKKTKQAEKDI